MTEANVSEDLDILKEPISILKNNGLVTYSSVSAKIFFKYEIATHSISSRGLDLDNLLLLLNVSNRKDLKVYIGHSEYPSAEGEGIMYALGDLTDDELKQAIDKSEMRRSLSAVDVFKYDITTDKILYSPTYFDNDHALLTSLASGFINTDKLFKLTTYKPSGGLCTILWKTIPTSDVEPPNRIDFLMNARDWKLKKSLTIYIGVYNSRPEDGPIDFTIQMRE